MNWIVAACIGAVGGILVTLLGSIVKGYAGGGEQVKVKVLKGRRAMYEKVKTLLDSAQISVIDTTWGGRGPSLLAVEKMVRDEYREAALKAMRRLSRYREIVTGDSLQEADHLYKDPNAGAYEYRLLSGVEQSEIPLIDFVVVDGTHVIMAQVELGSTRENRFLYANSRELGTLLTGWFDSAWHQGTPPRSIETG